MSIKLRSRRDRAGMALVLVFVLGMVLTAFVVAWSSFRSGATWDVAGDHLGLETLGLAESAADEMALALGRLGNAPDGPLYRAMRPRERLKGAVLPGEWVLTDAARDELKSLDMVGFRHLVMKINGGEPLPRFDLVARDFDLVVHDGILGHELLDLQGEVRYTAGVRGEVPKRRVTRTVTRRQGFRLTRLALPHPFDSMAFYSRDAHPAAGWGRATAVGEQIHDSLEQVETVLEPMQKVGGMGTLRDRIRTMRGRFAPGSFGIYDELPGGGRRHYTAASLYAMPETAAIPDLRAWQLGGVCEAGIAPLRAAWDPLIAELTHLRDRKDATRAAELEKAVDQYLDQVDDFRKRVEDHFREGAVFLPYTHSRHRGTLDPALDLFARFDAWASRAWYRLQDMKQMDRIFPSPEEYGKRIARHGLVHLKPSEGTTAILDTASIWGSQAGEPGRLLVLVDGDARVERIETHAQGLVTIVTRGTMTVTGEVRACLAAIGGLTLTGGTKIRGNVAHLGGALRVDPGVSIERDARIMTGSVHADAKAGLYHLALDPTLETERVH